MVLIKQILTLRGFLRESVFANWSDLLLKNASERTGKRTDCKIGPILYHEGSLKDYLNYLGPLSPRRLLRLKVSQVAVKYIKLSNGTFWASFSLF